MEDFFICFLMTKDIINKIELISPCGMNCSICASNLALNNNLKNRGVQMPYCSGCRPRDKKCAFIKKNCDLINNNKIRYCYECEEFPCKKLKAIDKRYRTNYRMSMIENLKFIKEYGIEKFLDKENKKWKCHNCSGIISCHNGLCFKCDLDKLKHKKKLYRWEE
jgi:hypothetical protein